MSWRDDAPQSVQDDLDDLLDAALNVAEQRLTDHGEFRPFGLAIETSGGRRLLESAAGDARRAKELSFATLGTLRAELRAAAVVVDVTLPQTGGSGIEIHLEHADGPAISVLEPYTLSEGTVQAGPLEGHTAQHVVW